MYCKKCGAQMDDTAIFCPRCAAPTDNYVAPKKEDIVKQQKSKTWPLVIGIISIILAMFILLQSCAVGLSNAIEENGEGTGTVGFFVAAMYIAGGIVLIATRKKASRIAPIILYIIGAVFGLLFDSGSYGDLPFWGGLSLVAAVMCLVSTIRSKPKKVKRNTTNTNDIP